MPKRKVAAEMNPDEVKQMKINDYFDLQLFADVLIGSAPQQKAKVIVDTGSDWFWVNSNACTDCGGHNPFNPHLSTTLQYDYIKLPTTTHIKKERSLFYGSGGVYGHKASDKVCLT